MSREVRRVPMDWQHPMEWREQWDRAEGRVMKCVPKPLFEFDLYAGALADSLANPADCDCEAPDLTDYMPDFGDRDDLGYCMYETTSEGTPISPTFATPEELAHWLADTGASAFGGRTATYEQWLGVARGGWAPSAVVDGHGLRSGVEAMGERQ